MAEQQPESKGQQQAGVPRNVAIIMDGNARWARRRMLPVIAGHRAGLKALRKILPYARKLGIAEVSLFAFSSENWQRPAAEVEALMQLFREAISEETDNLRREQARLRFIGDRAQFQPQLSDWMQKAEEASQMYSDFTVNIAMSYGGRWDLLTAARALIDSGIAADQLDEQLLRQHLPSAAVGDVDLLIRSSGEMRISNFLLWQLSYSELYFSEKLWPDFNETDLDAAVSAYAARQRRFGARV